MTQTPTTTTTTVQLVERLRGAAQLVDSINPHTAPPADLATALDGIATVLRAGALVAELTDPATAARARVPRSDLADLARSTVDGPLRLAVLGLRAATLSMMAAEAAEAADAEAVEVDR